MDAHDSRAYLFAQAELVRAMGMQIDSQVALLRLTSTTPIANDAVPFTGDDFNRQAFHIENLAREMTG